MNSPSPTQPRESVDALLQRAVTLHRGNQFKSAQGLYEQILAIDPHHADAHHLFGLLLMQLQNPPAALLHLEAAAHKAPDNPLFRFDYGRVLAVQGMVEAARTELSASLSIRPLYTEALCALGALERSASNTERALTLFMQALKLRENDPVINNNTGTLFKELKRIPEAVACFRRAVQIDPQAYHAWFNLALCLRMLGNLDDAAVALQYVVRFKPDMAAALSELSATHCLTGNLSAAEESLTQAMVLKPDNPSFASQRLFNRHYYAGVTRQMLLDEHRAWARAFAASVLVPVRTTRTTKKPLRIGYVSPDFYAHPVGFFMAPLFEHHDRSRFELFLYSNTQVHDRYTAWFKKQCTGWRDIKNQDDTDVRAMITNDDVDILVDCTGHAASNRLALFADHCAPVQISWLGYPSTTGLTSIEYRFTDEILDPAGSEDFYTEKLWRLPGGFACFRPHDTMPKVTMRATNKPIVFGSLHNPARLNEAVVARWCAVLAAVPGSMLMIYRMDLPESTKNRIIVLCDQQGIAPSRLIFKSAVPKEGYAAIYHEIDIALDTFPWSGHTTACEGLWMGVPIITQRNDLAVGRLAGSALHFAGLDELIADSASDYIAKAVALVQDRSRLHNLRATLRERLQKSTLCDETGFAAAFEAACLQMVEQI